jgi:hypothetical protein
VVGNVNIIQPAIAACQYGQNDKKTPGTIARANESRENNVVV